MVRALTLTANAFPLWILLACLWAWFQPSAWSWFGPYIRPGLGLIMLGMGLTLRFSDFRSVLSQPRLIAIGVALQFLVMPATAWAIASLFQLEAGLAIGLILVGCCPGGTASNVICYMARADVPLSVVLTLCSTTVAIFATPLLTSWLAGAWLPVDALALLASMIQIVLIPLLAGIAVHSWISRTNRAKSITKWIDAIGPLVSVAVIVLIVACIVGAKKAEISRSAGTLFLSILILHANGFFLGYLLTRFSGAKEAFRRTVSIEVGMQNSGLGATLAKEHFPNLAIAPVPAAISAVYHCLIGSLLAAIWRARPPAGLPHAATED